MNRFGSAFELTVHREDGHLEQLLHGGFDVRCPSFREVRSEIRRGEYVQTSCWYDNPDPQPLTWGISFYDETCYVLALIAPEGALDGGGFSTIAHNACVGGQDLGF
jgi:hypothetical protein